MRQRLGAILTVIGCLLGAGTARAGLYYPDEPEEVHVKLVQVPKFIDNFCFGIGVLRSIGMDKVVKDSTLRRQYRLIDELSGKTPVEMLTLDQKISLSAVYLRRRKFEEARDLLEKARTEDPDNILILSNLALANHRSGFLDRASDELRGLLRTRWPEQWTDLPKAQRAFLERMGWHQGIYEWHRRVEGFYLKLLRSRLVESHKKIEFKDEMLDPIFDDAKGPSTPVRFTNAEGKYDPAAAHAKLPNDAPEIVQQLLIWMPDDNRLYWLLGEVYAARGQPDDWRAAYKILDELQDPERRQYRPELLAEHLRVVRDRVAALPAEKGLTIDESDIAKAEPKPDDDRPFDWRSPLVGFGTGVIVAIFALWQIREIRRRRQHRQVA